MRSAHIYAELARFKREAKGLRGSSWMAGRPGSDRIDVLRGTRKDRLPKHPSSTGKP